MMSGVRLQTKERTEIFSVLSLYGINYKKLKIKKDKVGYINKTYFILANGKKWVLRKSNPATSMEHLKLEVALLDYLQKKHFKLTPRVIPNQKREMITFYRQSFFTLQKFMPGKVVASWNDLKRFNTPRLDSFFKTTAKFSKAVAGFPVRDNSEPSLLFYVENGKQLLQKAFEKIPVSPGKKLLKNKLQNLFDFIDETGSDFKRIKYDRLPKQIVHFDLHPGNVHYAGNKVVALFDFDWVRYDSRLCDLAAAIGQSCYYYGGKNEGRYRQDRVRRGLKMYRKVYGKSQFTREKENELVKVILKGYMFFQLLWAVGLYASRPSKENLMIFRQFVSILLANDYNRLFSKL